MCKISPFYRLMQVSLAITPNHSVKLLLLTTISACLLASTFATKLFFTSSDAGVINSQSTRMYAQLFLSLLVTVGALLIVGK